MVLTCKATPNYPTNTLVHAHMYENTIFSSKELSLQKTAVFCRLGSSQTAILSCFYACFCCFCRKNKLNMLQTCTKMFLINVCGFLNVAGDTTRQLEAPYGANRRQNVLNRLIPPLHPRGQKSYGLFKRISQKMQQIFVTYCDFQ